MDGGVDKAYSVVMFPGIRHRLQEVAKSVCPTNKIGQSYFQIGSALAVEIAAISTWSPQDVSTTNNAYHATRAALVCADAIEYLQELTIPAMCCGYGKMSAIQAARQICSAVLDRTRSQYYGTPWHTPNQGPSWFWQHECKCLYLNSQPEPEEEQPQVYANLDFRLVSASKS